MVEGITEAEKLPGVPSRPKVSIFQVLTRDKQFVFEISLVSFLTLVGFIPVEIAQELGRTHLANWSSFGVLFGSYVLLQQVLGRSRARTADGWSPLHSLTKLRPVGQFLPGQLEALLDLLKSVVKLLRSRQESRYLFYVSAFCPVTPPLAKEVVGYLHVPMWQGAVVLVSGTLAAAAASQVMARRRFQLSYKTTLETIDWMERTIKEAGAVTPQLVDRLEVIVARLREKGLGGLADL